MGSFVPARKSFEAVKISGKKVVIVPIAELKPPLRDPGTPKFEEERALSLLEAFRNGTPLPPIMVEIPKQSIEPYVYRVWDGFHRFHLSVSVGFTHIPAIIEPYTNIDDL
jgi:hypothetical protein